MATLSILADLNPNNYVNTGLPADLQNNLIADANGDIFGTIYDGGASSDGAVFEIVKTPTGYATAPITLVSFDGSDGMEPKSGLIADANGDLFGTTNSGGASGDGTAFEIAKTPTGYASAPTMLVSFNGSDGVEPESGLIADANGDLFGTTSSGGASGDGTAFKIAKTPTGYASAPTTLVSFDGSDGGQFPSGLIADANGDLFGTIGTGFGSASGGGTVFEIAKTPTGYASAPTMLVSFGTSGSGPSDPMAGLIADANGDLFGTTLRGGAYGYGTVFEIAKTPTGYASAPTTLVSFNGSEGVDPNEPMANLIADANGDLFGTTLFGGAYFDGAVFEIAKTPTGYASAPTILVNFGGASGAYPQGGLIDDADGDLFGTTPVGGLDNGGTVFEVTGRSAASLPPGPPNFFNSDDKADILWRNTNGEVELWLSNSSPGGFSYQNLGAVNTSWQIAGTGDFNASGEAGILWRNTDGGVELWNSNGSGGFAYDNLGVVNTSWQIAVTGNFNGDGEDILWHNTNGDTELWNDNGSGGFTYENLGAVNPSWQIVGTGDFTGTGEDSIVWRNTNGDVELWLSNDGPGSEDATDNGFTYDDLGVVSTSWQIAGTGDFNGSRKAGILWRNTDGDVELWNPNEGPGFTGENLGVVNTSWQIVGTGDFTGTGADSILWRNTNGDTELWNPNGLGGFTYQNLGVVGTGWSVQKNFA